MVEEYIPFLKIPYGFSISTPTPFPPILRIVVAACVRNRDNLDSLPLTRRQNWAVELWSGKMPQAIYFICTYLLKFTYVIT